MNKVRIRNTRNNGYWRASTCGWTVEAQATVYAEADGRMEMEKLLNKPKYQGILVLVSVASTGVPVTHE